VPVLGPFTYRVDSSSNLLWVALRSAGGVGGPRTGLAHDTPGASVAFVRDDTLLAAPTTLRPAHIGRYTAGGFVQVDQALLPGVYEFGPPDEVFAAGGHRVLILFRFPGVRLAVVPIDLVAHDPWDPVTVGIGGLGDRSRHAFLREAMPAATHARLTEGDDLERRLTERLAASDAWGGGRWSGSGR
jgi:hypothetical protein